MCQLTSTNIGEPAYLCDELAPKLDPNDDKRGLPGVVVVVVVAARIVVMNALNIFFCGKLYGLLDPNKAMAV